ncbi:MAG: hypothetical protein DRN61_05805 [Thaumarchaeota archaeon]|nr:MAG: hypothetical protein DRN61_05805 [Nitrososphaerota archaeon]
MFIFDRVRKIFYRVRDIIFNGKEKMSAETVLDDLAQTYSEDLQNLKRTHIRVLRIIREYHLDTNRWPRAREIENEYGSTAVYNTLEEMQRYRWVERVESGENGGRRVVYRLTKVGETLVILSRWLLERYRREAARRLLEELRLGIEALSILSWRRNEVERLAQVLADESVRLARSRLYEKYARDSVIRVNDRMLFEEAKSILKDAQNSEELRRNLFSNTLTEFFELSNRPGDRSASKVSVSRRRRLEKELEKLIKYPFLSQRRRRFTLAKLRVLKFLSRGIRPLIYFSGIIYLLSLAITFALTLFSSSLLGIIYLVIPTLYYLLSIIFLAIACTLIRLRPR